MRVSFDSNVWEKIFDAGNVEYFPIRAAAQKRELYGFLSEMWFRIEAIQKKDREIYFSSAKSNLIFHGIVERDGGKFVHLSFGPDDRKHPGLPKVARQKLESARKHGLKLMRARAWMGLPNVLGYAHNQIFADDFVGRELLQHEICCEIEQREVGKWQFDKIGGWNQFAAEARRKRVSEACAEWADQEFIAAHIAYGNDILCTEDFGKSSKKSVLDFDNRSWLQTKYGINFMTATQLVEALLTRNQKQS